MKKHYTEYFVKGKYPSNKKLARRELKRARKLTLQAIAEIYLDTNLEPTDFEENLIFLDDAIFEPQYDLPYQPLNPNARRPDTYRDIMNHVAFAIAYHDGHYPTLKQVFTWFEEGYTDLDKALANDRIAVQTEWTNYLDMLQRDAKISSEQAFEWPGLR